jgi:hypothetical protein
MKYIPLVWKNTQFLLNYHAFLKYNLFYFIFYLNHLLYVILWSDLAKRGRVALQHFVQENSYTSTKKGFSNHPKIYFAPMKVNNFDDIWNIWNNNTWNSQPARNCNCFFPTKDVTSDVICNRIVLIFLDATSLCILLTINTTHCTQYPHFELRKKGSKDTWTQVWIRWSLANY